MRECGEFEITIEKLFKVIHRYTEQIAIYVVIGDAWLKFDEAKRMHDFYITEDAYVTEEEAKRILKYYKDVPVWNLHVVADEYRPYVNEIHRHGYTVRYGICANCHYEDIREGYLAEKLDRQREKRRLYRQRKKEREENGTD